MLITFEEIKKYFLPENFPKNVIHIGAHHAEELTGYLSIGINQILWIEANPMVFYQLEEKIKHHEGSKAYCFAAHEKDNLHINFNIANNGESSSILDFGTHSSEHPHVKFINKINVTTKKIDSFIEENEVSREQFDFINIDIQGAELLALRGMQKQLSFCNYLYLEVNEKHLYEDCSLIKDVDEFLSNFSFERKITKMTQHGWGDAFYVKNK